LRTPALTRLLRAAPSIIFNATLCSPPLAAATLLLPATIVLHHHPIRSQLASLSRKRIAVEPFTRRSKKSNLVELEPRPIELEHYIAPSEQSSVEFLYIATVAELRIHPRRVAVAPAFLHALDALLLTGAARATAPGKQKKRRRRRKQGNIRRGASNVGGATVKEAKNQSVCGLVGNFSKHYASRRLTTSLNLMDKVPSQGEGKPNQIVCDADAAQKIQEMDCGQSSDETLQGGARKRKTNADLATNLAENEDNGQLTTVSEKHLQLRSILATLLAEESQENLITKILGLLTEITAKKKTSRKRSKTLKETETAKDSPTSNAKPSATHTQESRSKSISAPLQQENEATPPGEQQPLRQPQPSGKDTTKGGQDENAADNDDNGFIKVTNKRKRPRREPQPDTQKPNEHLKEVRIRPKSKTPMGEWKLEILGYLEKTLEIKREDVTLKYFPNSNTISVRTNSKEVLQKIMENYTYENAKGEKIEVSTYQAYWKKHIKGVIYDADITGEAESLIDLVDSKQVPVVAARRMGNTKTVAITFEGEKLPRSILFN
ncbi:hypothetical protein HPB47_013283, partial [Ixodes persulcatus]